MSVAEAQASDNEKGPIEIPEHSPRKITGWKWIAFMVAVLSSAFLFALDNTIVANVQPVIVLEFNSISKLSWMSTALLMTAASTNLIWGKVFAQFEAKWTYIICVAMFELGSGICGLAQNMDTMIIARAICGLGGSGMYVGVLTLIAANTTIRERPLYISFTGLVWGLGTVLGPIIGGAFSVSAGGWRWSFYINLIIGLVCTPVYIFLLPKWDPRPGVGFLERAREMDYLGSVLTVGAFLSGVMPISFGGVQYAWSSPEIISMFVCSGVLFIILGIQQTYCILTTKENRVFPVEFVKSRTMLVLFGCSAIGGGIAFLTIYMIPIFFQFTRNDSALESGIRLLPYIFLLIFGIFLNGFVLSLYGLYMPWFVIGSVFSIVGGALMYTVTSTTSIATVYGYSVILGWGLGLYIQSGFSIAQALVEPNIVSLAIGFISCAQLSGITIILSTANSIFLNRATSSLVALLPGQSQEQISSSIAGAGSTFVKSLDSELKVKVLSAVVRANSDTYLLAIVGGALTLVMSLLLKREKLFMPSL
ncbi:Efflux pump [Erysiphe necator]|uniref:Putative mfs drug efflux n=1 Tax=Uncinula necator TaxID=52586 RepID=A0A0B1P8E5_UNCNE|nr:Efflux pump [Erysiphe necator]KHJ32924.1 putative mfs drug efflux [Erysiphe necator]